MMSKPLIGILAHRTNKTFMNGGFLHDLVREGEKLNSQVVVFSHLDLIEKDKKIHGFTRSPSNRWKMNIYPYPDVVIDFCRYLKKPFRDMRRRKDLFTYANHKFTYKWKATRLFSKSEKVKQWIPETLLYTPQNLRDMIRKHPILYIKPGNGTGGHSVVKLSRKSGTFHIKGRKKSARLTHIVLPSEDSAVRWLNSWVSTQRIRTGNFMIQQGLNLELIPGRVLDARLIIQKNERGGWEVTGKGMRVSAKNSPTTNLVHGDGKALRFEPFMIQRFGPEKAKQISRECDQMAMKLMEVIEERYGSMVEFGLDVGVDVKGNVWLIEANPKPSHTIFLGTKEMGLYRKSIQRPIQYAAYLAKTKFENGS
ncbi:YheC/YheD family endospore coat-associated protein [Paenibacillus eucommiae]|uniref:YheC/YheD family protein n=1 Tax=Paenibacillus eucommiae TaxID=1355755 RepID=A0ABS4IMH1_9BACL|nr:YheC/YheD family protein [Paenibacillus eucommiae]MBP1988708.1 hypothetical protein [Paenibacillus eucommiae]